MSRVTSTLNGTSEIQAGACRWTANTALNVSITFTVSEQEYPSYSPGLTAHPVVNVVPYVCDAAAGMLHTEDLPMIVPYFGA